MTDPVIIKGSLKILLYATCGDSSEIQYVMSNINITKIRQFLDSEFNEIKKSAVRILGNICCASSYAVEEVIDTNCLPKIKEIIKSKSELTRSSCLMISNISSDSISSIQKLIDLFIFEDIAEVITSDMEIDVICINK